MATIVMIGVCTLDARLWREEARAAVAGARTVAVHPSSDPEAVRALAPTASVVTPPEDATSPESLAAWLRPLAEAAATAPLVWLETGDPLWMDEAAARAAALRSSGVDLHAVHGAPAAISPRNFDHALWRVEEVPALETHLEAARAHSDIPTPPGTLARMRRAPLQGSSSAAVPWSLATGTKLPIADHPLVGRRIASTHAPVQDRVSFSVVLAGVGATGVPIPCLEFAPPSALDPLDEATRALHARGVIVTSAQGVHALVDSLTRVHGDLTVAREVLSAAEVAVIGPRTADALARHGVTPRVVATPSHAEGLVDALHREGMLSQPWTLFRADEGRDTLGRAITDAGGELRVIEAYRVVAPDLPPPRLRALLASPLDALCVTSGRAARQLLHLVERHTSPGAARPWLRDRPLVSIGPVTTKALHELGLDAAQTADDPSHAGLIRALARLFTDAAT